MGAVKEEDVVCWTDPAGRYFCNDCAEDKGKAYMTPLTEDDLDGLIVDCDDCNERISL